jgi:hypothetical protein
MKGAREYAELFATGQHGRLYLVSGSHARGRTFGIYVLPAGERAIANGINNPPFNVDAVEVYGVVSGRPGWDESYGWLHLGPWRDDFAVLAEKARHEKHAEEGKRLREQARVLEENRERELRLLSTY